MDVVFARCAGIDVHKRTVVVCRLTRDGQGERVAETQTFGTSTSELLRLSDWLAAGGGRGLHACGPRKHWGILETGVQHPGGHVPGLAAQHGSHQCGARAQDGCQGCAVDRRTLGPWARPPQLHLAAPATRVARSDTLSYQLRA